MNKLLQWFDTRFPLFIVWKNYFSNYYVPKNLNLLYFFGSLALLLLANQCITGLWLTMFYTPSVDQAFSSIEYIMRDVNYGWLFRYLHTTGASVFFIIIYLHLFRGLLYGSYQRPRELVWLLGMVLYVLLFAAAFLGYLLPWGQMSYWGAEVITSLVGAIPYVGEHLMLWLRGDYFVSNVTLQRFFALHVIAVPFLLLLFVFFHLVALHQVGSNNPEGIEIKESLDEQGKPLDGIPFYPHYVIKDSFAALIFLLLFLAIVFFAPEMGGYFLEANNFLPANPLVTPEHIAPMWYFSPFYAILRIVPNKMLGILAMIAAISVFFLLPWLDKSPVRSMRYKGPMSRWMLGIGVVAFVLLGYLGTLPLTPMRLGAARFSALGYFAYFLLMPWYTRWEKTRPLPSRIGS